MTPHELRELVLSNASTRIDDHIFALWRTLSSATHFDAGSVFEIPFNKTLPLDVRPPFKSVSVSVLDARGVGGLYGCFDKSDEDGYWYCFFAMRLAGGAIGIDEFRFCPRTGSLEVLHGANFNNAECGIWVLCNFFAVIACSNVRVVDVPAPEALNKKRIKNGRLPILSHKVLHLVAPTTYSKTDHQGGTHNSPRVHLRRGHIRRLPSGVNIWVQQCVVGSKHGIVTKDYAVSYAAAA
jgi:hypothetical protein